MRIFLGLILCFLNSLATYSQENYTTVNIYKKNGETVTFLLSAHPQMTFLSDSVFVIAADSSKFQALRSEIEEITFERGIPNEIDILESLDKQVFFKYIDEHSITIYGIDNMSSIRIYDITGKIFKPEINSIDSKVFEINLSELPSGIYIINADGNSIKIRK